jgi:nitrite reductase (cytochrome c-552)
MPYRREGALKVTDHFIASPLLDINASCQTCHRQSEQDLKRRVQLVQERTAVQLKETEGAVLALIDDIVSAEAALRAARQEPSDPAFEADVAKALAPAREAHRRASMRWDFISSENSTGFHSPQEASRVLGAAAQIARSGQLALVRSMKERGLDLSPTVGYGKLPPAGSPIEPRPSPVGDAPSRELLELDQRLERDVTVLSQPHP